MRARRPLLLDPSTRRVAIFGPTLAATWVLLSLAAILAAPPAVRATSAASELAGTEPRFVLRAVGAGDSLIQAALGGPEALQRLWKRGDLERAAEGLRERLAGLERYGAVVRLELATGWGSSPGAATLSLAGLDGTTHARAVASVSAPDGARPRDAAGAFARGSHGSAAPAAIAAGLAAVRDQAVAQGRFAALVVIDSIVPAGPDVRVHLTVRAGPSFAFESLELPGATITRPRSAASIAGLRSGEAITPALLEQTRGRLQSSGLFAWVGEPRVVPGGEPGRARVSVPVEEANASRFEGALGIAQGGGLTGQVDLALGNIAGTGRAAGARWAGVGQGRSLYALHYREPALLGRPVDASFALDADVADSLFTQTRWAFALGGAMGRRARGLAGVSRSGTVYTGAGRGSSETWSLRGRLAWEGLDRRQNPSGGIEAAVEAEAGNRTETYPGLPEAVRPLRRGLVKLATAASLGGAKVLFGSVRAEGVSLGTGDFPAEELRYVGGSEGLRGHRDRAYAGSRVLAATLEHRWLTGSRGGRAYLFLDAAGHALDGPIAAGIAAGGAPALARTSLSDGWEWGYGAGLMTRVATGLMGLDLGIRPGASLREATLHLKFASTW